MKILVVDDIEDARIILATTLEEAGFAVEVANNGVQALDLVRRSRPDMIISDILMPEMDGFALCRAIKSDEQLRTIPFVFYTATYVEAKDEKLAMALGAFRFIVKPMEPGEFLKVIAEVLREYEGGKFTAPERTIKDGPELSRMYPESLARKLDKRVQELQWQRQALEESEEHKRLLLMSTAEAIYGIDLNGNCTFANSACLLMLGYRDQQDLLGKNIHALIHHTRANGEAYPEKECRIYQAFRKGIGTRVDDEVLWRADGSSFPTEYWSNPIQKNDQVVGSVVNFVDITERKRIEAERENIAVELAQLIDTSNTPIWGIDTKGKVNKWNQQVASLTGYTKEEVMGRDWMRQLIVDEYKASMDEVLAKALKGEETSNYEFALNTRENKRRRILLNVTARRDVGGNIIGVIGIGQDITELREKEAALQQAQKMEMVGQLTGGIAHDFSNLLSVISGNLRFLKQDIGAVSEAIDNLFDDAFSAVEDGTELTRRLLAFSRARSLEPRVTNVHQAIQKLIRFLSRTLGENFELDINTTAEELYIRVDRSQLDNALLNLVINARDAIPEGGKLTIGVERYQINSHDTRIFQSLPKGDYVIISVNDMGIGISAENLEHVFEPFFTTKEVGAGSGLGLSMVYGFAQQSGGACHIDSKPGKGTTVAMFFPEVEEVTEGKEAHEKEQQLPGGSETILVVEDEQRVRKVTVRDLKNLGYRILEAENANAAIKVLESESSIDIMLSDVLMPGGMDGYKLAKWVQEHHPKIKIMLTSGYSRKISDPETIEKQSFPLLKKPYSIDRLANQIRAILDGESQ